MKIRITDTRGPRPEARGQIQSPISDLRPPTSEQGIALVITLIMLAVTLVMAVAFLALSRRERTSVTTSTDTTVARLAAESAESAAEAQIVANILNGLTTNSVGVLGSGNAYNLRVMVSTNYINPAGFNNTLGYVNPTNVSYTYPGGGFLSGADLMQNVANLWFLPRAPVFITTNPAVAAYDFRYYLDVNENGRYDQYGYIPEIGHNGGYMHPDGTEDNNPVNSITNLASGGDPEWIGILEHPDQPHGPNNHFTSRYAFFAQPIGNTMDLNYVHNQARNTSLSSSDGFMRNQSVGSWEINLAAFLADLNTNIWAAAPLPDPNYYIYNQPLNTYNRGLAFQDALSMLKYRYGGVPLVSATLALNNANNYVLNTFKSDCLDAYSDGSLQTTLNTNTDFPVAPLPEGDNFAATTPWSGADNPNHFYSISDLFDGSKVGTGAGSFTNHIRIGNGITPFGASTYDRYTLYRMLDEIGFDSSSDYSKLNLNYSNAIVHYFPVNGVYIATNVTIIPGAETNLVPWMPQDFFIAASDRLLRYYTAEWFQSDPTNYMITYYGYYPRGELYGSGLGVTNFPNYGQTNQIPAFGINNIPVMINSNFVYSPAINRLLQLAANLYDATTTTNNNMPHVFRPIFEHDPVGNVFIVSYTNLYSVNGPNTINGGSSDPQLIRPLPIFALPSMGPQYTPILTNGVLANVYGVPWIIGAKKGFPAFNQLSLVNVAQITRKLMVSRTSTDSRTATYYTNQMYDMSISNNLGISFWNSYSADYPRPVRIYAQDFLSETLSNSTLTTLLPNWSAEFDIPGVIQSAWPGAHWSGTPPNQTPQARSFVRAQWTTNYLPDSICYVAPNTQLSFPLVPWTSPGLAEFPLVHLMITNELQAYILDGNQVIDYVQLRDPITIGNINRALADPNYPDPFHPTIHYQWSTNGYTADPLSPPWGVINQLWVSGHPPDAPVAGGRWSTAPTPMGETTPPAEAAFYNGFFTPTFQYNGQDYVNNQLTIQAPYTPSRTVFSSYLLQANDPLVHYSGTDLNAQYGATAYWANKMKWHNGVWNHIDSDTPLPIPPTDPIGGRFQPWLRLGQMDGLANVIPVTNNYSVKDPLVETPDNWDFPTNLYPSVGWIGRVHRGSPWQTVYLKDADMLKNSTVNGYGTNTWANWIGDGFPLASVDQPQGNWPLFFDAANSAPVLDRLLFDIFTTRMNDNSTRGALPVNQSHLAAWSAILSGLMVLSNDAPRVFGNTPLSYIATNIDPAGIMNPTLVDGLQPPVWRIVNGTNGINVTRANTNLFAHQAFVHVGDVLATPALTKASPFLNLGNTSWGNQQMNFGINDEMYEWLPEHIMGLLKASEPRYVLYCVGQTLRPAPNGTVLSGSFFQLITNYQVTAESAVRAVIHVEDAETTHPHAVVESYNVLPPN